MIAPIPVLMIWPVIAVFLMAVLRFDRALIVTVVAGYLFLPDNVKLDLPLLPPFNKHSVISFALLFGWLFTFLLERRAYSVPPTTNKRLNSIVFLCILALLGSHAFTVATNGDPLIKGISYRPGLGLRDFISMTVATLLALPPFLLARRYLATAEAHRQVLVVLVCFALVYSLPTLFEWRMSPQLNKIVYGYFPHSWQQHVRGGGFRPLVFLDHGLSLGFFLVSALLSAFALTQSERGSKRAVWLFSGLWLLVILLISRNMAASIFGLLSLILLIFTWRTLQVRVCWMIALLILIYPALHQASLLPMRAVAEYFETVAPERAQSLSFRLDNEDDLVARAFERPLWGWGGHGRNRVFDEEGRDTTTVDGVWIGRLSTQGYIGYLAFFGILSSALLALPRVARQHDVPPETICIALVTAVNLVYLIPNSTLTPIGWLFAGALAGYCQRVVTTPQTCERTNSGERATTLPYARGFLRSEISNFRSAQNERSSEAKYLTRH